MEEQVTNLKRDILNRAYTKSTISNSYLDMNSNTETDGSKNSSKNHHHYLNNLKSYHFQFNRNLNHHQPGHKIHTNLYSSENKKIYCKNPENIKFFTKLSSISTEVKSIEEYTNCCEIGHLASFSVSSCKSNHGVKNLRDLEYDTYWQSEGQQPHFIKEDLAI